MIDIKANSREFKKAKEWFDSEGPGFYFRLKQVSGIITEREYQNAFEKEFNCSVNLKLDDYGHRLIDSITFKNDRDATLFALRWS